MSSRQSTPASVFLAGDFVGPSLARGRSPFGPRLGDRIDDADLSLVNLEAPIPDEDEPIDKSGPSLQSAPAVPDVLASAGFDAVTLANNHVMDYDVAGLERTLEACESAGLDTVGAGDSIGDAARPITVNCDGTSVAVVNVCEREFGIADETSPGVAWLGHPQARRQVRLAADAADVVVAVVHGGVEYVPVPPPNYARRLHELVRHGADAVVAHHPHVPQGAEYVDGAPVYYSLGNCYFEMDGGTATRCGLGVELQVSDGRLLTDRALPLVLTEGTVEDLRDGTLREEVRNHVATASEMVADREAHLAHWQEVADRVFLGRYGSWFRRALGATGRSLLRDPFKYLRRDGLWDGTKRREELLVLLNLLRNESHRELVQTALEVRTGQCRDLRTRAVEDTVRDRLEWTSPRSLYDRPSPVESTISGVSRRVRARTPEIGDLAPR
jgi:poly-gamma-glutamate synthesis protein (capsule biosynthesis protein)